MITMLWKKHWMELRSIWALSTAFAVVPAIVVAREAEMSRGPAAHLIQGFMFIFAGFMLHFFLHALPALASQRRWASAHHAGPTSHSFLRSLCPFGGGHFSSTEQASACWQWKPRRCWDF